MSKLYWIILIAAIAMGIYACLPIKKQARQVNIPLYPVKDIQRELVNRGHAITVDGKFGKNTDHALTVELTN